MSLKKKINGQINVYNIFATYSIKKHFKNISKTEVILISATSVMPKKEPALTAAEVQGCSLSGTEATCAWSGRHTALPPRMKHRGAQAHAVCDTGRLLWASFPLGWTASSSWQGVGVMLLQGWSSAECWELLVQFHPNEFKFRCSEMTPICRPKYV